MYTNLKEILPEVPAQEPTPSDYAWLKVERHRQQIENHVRWLEHQQDRSRAFVRALADELGCLPDETAILNRIRRMK